MKPWLKLALVTGLCASCVAGEGERDPRDFRETDAALPDAAQSDAGWESTEEPVNEADYFVRNDTERELLITATNLAGEPVELLESSVPKNSEVRIYHAIEGSGGHTMPSNFFAAFSITQAGGVLYEGVNDQDWVESGHKFSITVQSKWNYACERASDCGIEDVGNCCGAYPRCVNAAAPFTSAVGQPSNGCDGVAGVCGFPEISSCACIQNTCRSMQGDREI